MTNKTIAMTMMAAAISAAGCAKLGAAGLVPGGTAPAAAAAAPGADGATLPVDDGSGENPELARRFGYQKLAAPHRQVLADLAAVEAGRWSFRTPEATVAAFADRDGLAGFARDCKAYVDVQVPGAAKDEQPAATCALAARRDVLAAQAYRTSADEGLDGKIEAFRSTIAWLAEGKVVSEPTLADLLGFAADPAPAVAALRAELAPLYAALGEDVPADRFAALTALAPQVTEAVRASQAAVGIGPARSKDTVITGAIRLELDGARVNGAPLRVLGVNVVAADWTIYETGGVPSIRSKLAHALVQAKGEPFCRLYPFEARQQYAGGGTWSKGVTVENVRGVHVARCK